MNVNTTVMQGALPESLISHRFGVSLERWNGINNKSYWITGAGTGYGHAIAHILVASGATVFMSGRRKHVLDEALEGYRSLGLSVENCHIVPMDLQSADSINEGCKYVRAHCDQLHGLINNAGVSGGMGSQSPLRDADLACWQNVMNTNVTAPWLLTQSIFPHMVATGSPRVLFITSEAGWAGTPGVGVYNVSKAALNSLAHSMAQEYALNYPEVDVQMNTLVPGEAKTEMNREGVDSPYAIVSMVLALLTCSQPGPNGCFFHRDGRHLSFGHTHAYPRPLS